jgi:hypothetical protein
MENSGDIAQFIGRFHIVLVHLPLGILLLLGFLELIALKAKWHQATSANRYILSLAAPVAVMTAAAGWFLAGAGGYDERLLFLHRWTGVATAVALCILLFVHSRGWLGLYRPLILGSVALGLVAGHFGGSLTHGRGYLTRYAPGWLGGAAGGGEVATAKPAGFASIEPVLSEFCGACHGPEKAKGGFRVNSWEHLREGGAAGPAIVPGEPGESPILNRMLLALDHDDHMPPEGKPQPTWEQVEQIRGWIQAGALE